MSVTGLPSQHLDTERLQLLQRTLGGRRLERRQQPRPGFDENHPRAARVGHAEVARDHVDRQLLDRAGQLHAGGAAADDDERQVRRALRQRSVSNSAASKDISRRERMSVASSTSFMPGANARPVARGRSSCRRRRARE